MLLNDIPDPDVGSYKEICNNTLYDLETADDGKHQGDVHVGKTGKNVCRRYHENPGIDAVENERDQGIAAGSHDEVGSVGVRAERHQDSRYHYESRRKRPDIFRRVVEKGEHG